MAAVSRQVYLALFCDAQIDIRAMRSGAICPHLRAKLEGAPWFRRSALNARLATRRSSSAITRVQEEEAASQRAPGAAEDGADPHSSKAARASRRTALEANCRTVRFRSSRE